MDRWKSTIQRRMQRSASQEALRQITSTALGRRRPLVFDPGPTEHAAARRRRGGHSSRRTSRAKRIDWSKYSLFAERK